jgi:hypothetical protein
MNCTTKTVQNLLSSTMRKLAVALGRFGGPPPKKTRQILTSLREPRGVDAAIEGRVVDRRDPAGIG